MAEITQPQTTAKSSINIIYYILAVVCATAFFIHEYPSENTDQYTEDFSNHISSKKQRTKALNNVKKAAIDTPEYSLYLVEKEKTDQAFKKLLNTIESEKFIGFDNFQRFLGEIGWAIGLLIYSLFNMTMTFIRKNKSLKGEIVLHTTLIFISIYFIKWAFQLSNDYSRVTYVIYSIVMSLITVYGTHVLVKHKGKYIDSLILNIKDLTGFVLNNTKDSSEDKMWNVLKKIKHDRK